MQARLPGTLALLFLTARATLHSQTVPHPLRDSARLFGTEWDATTLVRADSTASDSATLRRIDWAYSLGPRRLVYSGQLAVTGRRALLGWVDGRVTLLAVDGREFTAPNGRAITVRFGQGWRPPTQFAAAGGAFYVSVTTGRGFSLYATDGERWRVVAHRDDSLTIRGRKTQVGSALVVGADAAGRPLLVLDADRVHGMVVVGAGGIEPIVADRDTLADGTVLPSGITHPTYGMWPTFRTAGDTWSILFGGRALPSGGDVYGATGGRTSLIARSTERMPGDATRDWQAIQSAFPLEDGRFLILVRRNGSLLTGRPGDWRVIAAGNAWHRERAAVFAIGDATLVDSAGVLVALVQGDQQMLNGRIDGRFDDLYRFDGSTLRALPWDSLLGTTVHDWRRSSPGGGFELNGSISFRSVPGYPARTVVRTPFLREVPDGRLRPVELLYDPGRQRLVPMPALRVAGRAPVSLSDIIGWNGPDELIVTLSGEIAVLHRRP